MEYAFDQIAEKIIYQFEKPLRKIPMRENI